MLSPNLRRKLMPAAMFIVPLALVKITAIVLGGAGPLAAQAHSGALSPPGALRSPAQHALSPAQRAALEHVVRLKSEPFAQAPFQFPGGDETPPTPAQSDPGNPNPSPQAKPVLQMIMSAPNGSRALISGRTYLVGDVLAGTNWVVISIRADARTVTLRDWQSGRTLELTVEMPK